MGTEPSSRMSTSVLHGGEVWKWITNFSQTRAVCEFAKLNLVQHGTNSNQIFAPRARQASTNAITRGRDPIDLVHPESKITWVGCCARSSFCQWPIPDRKMLSAVVYRFCGRDIVSTINAFSSFSFREGGLETPTSVSTCCAM